MKRKIGEWRIEEIFKRRERISFPDYQREPKLWSRKEKELLINSILEEIDIPALYFYMPQKDEYHVVDGQQRLWAIWEFIDGEFTYRFKGSMCKFEQLSASIQKKY